MLRDKLQTHGLRGVRGFKSTRANRQRGAALITTLLIVALITITVTSMTSQQQLSMQRAGNRQVQTQLVNLIGAGEKFAMAVLRRDRVEGERNNSDSTEDFWAQSLPPVPVDGATVEGCVIDLQGKFNLNNLVNEEGVTDAGEFEQLKLLLSALAIDTQKAEAILDWIDPNIDATGAAGAEDDFYTGQSPAYRAANGPMVSPTELLLVSGFRVVDEGGIDDYDTLLPHITTLPYGTAVNVNTASGAVLSSLAEYMSEISDDIKVVDDGYWTNFPDCPEGGGLLDTLINSDGDDSDPDGGSADDGAVTDEAGEEEQNSFVYENIEQFKQDARGDTEEKTVENANIVVSSGYFLSRVTVTRDESSVTQYTTMFRDNTGAIRTIRRSRGGL
jgi:general secretion pathway protein K